MLLNIRILDDTVEIGTKEMFVTWNVRKFIRDNSIHQISDEKMPGFNKISRKEKFMTWNGGHFVSYRLPTYSWYSFLSLCANGLESIFGHIPEEIYYKTL